MPNRSHKSIDPSAPTVVSIRRVGKCFASQTVLSDVSIDVYAGEIFVLMGKSGAGKSVLLRIVAGLESATSGEVRIHDCPVLEARNRWLTALVFQSGALFNSMDVYDNLALYLREHRRCGECDIKKRVFRVLDLLSLADAAHKLPSELSGGMRKRVAIARGLVMEPEIMLYDEPTSELDPVTGASIVEIIGSVSRKMQVTTIVVSHDPRLALSIGHRIAILKKGVVERVEAPDWLARSTDPAVQEFFNPKIDLDHPRFQSLRL
jgi:phospholipid/cholesterol/gamma-HCH transport system ATP-binding protein